MSDKVTYKVFEIKGEAIRTATLIENAGIDYELDDYSQVFDPSFANIQGEKEYRIKLEKQDFEKADALLEAEIERELQYLAPDYYLLSFSDAELREVVEKKHEWSLFDYVLALQLLRERGIPVSDAELEQMRAKRVANLSKPVGRQYASLALGFLFALCGGVLGLLIGWYISSQKKTLPNGEQVYAFSKPDRKWGRRICYFAGVMWILWICFFMFSD